MSETLKVVLVGIVSLALNVPLGVWRARCRKFSIHWLIAIHLSVPLIIALRIYLEVNLWFIPLFIALAVAGQFVGAKRWPASAKW